MSVYASEEFRRLALGVRLRPWEAYMLTDWLMDEGVPDLKAAEAIEPPTTISHLPYSGIGIGRGRGIGIGIGRGRGRGRGRGIGIGRGRGIGIGIGIGRGRGIGIGIGIGRGSVIEEIIMEIGKAYLIQTVDWFSWVGRVKRQCGPWEYEMESCSKISDTTQGDNWQHLAAGNEKARKAAKYEHYTTPVILGLGVVAKIEWLSQTPQEAGIK